MASSGSVLGFICIFCCTVLTLSNEFDGEAIAKTKDHQFEGKTVTIEGKKVSEYLGIRYAAPPVGKLRFQKPQPYSSGEIISYDISEPSACWQLSSYPFPWYDEKIPKSEDCLFLNIWAPGDATPDNKKAVIYFIHGGGMRFGSIRQKIYQGAILAALGDVIVVTVNYRVGPFGFLTSGTDDAPGNVGLWDILEGLKWVNSNIEGFGGDKSRITIAGAGSGADAVGLLSVSPLAENLYKRQIMQSGSPVHLDKDNKEKNTLLSQALAERLNCANATFTIKDNATASAVVDCLKKTNPLVLAGVDSTIDPLAIKTYVPQFGDELLPQDPTTTVLEPDMNCNELLIGSTLDEGATEVTMQEPLFFGFFGQRDPIVDKKTGERMVKDIFRNFTNPNAVLAHYLPSTINGSKEIRKQVYRAAGDFSRICPITYYAEKCAEQDGKVFYYEWRERPNNSPWSPWMGVPHGSELSFIFGQPIENPDYFSPQQVELSRKVIEIWSSFAKSGDPGIPWPSYSNENPDLKYLGPNGTLNTNGTGPQTDNCDFFRPYYQF